LLVDTICRPLLPKWAERHRPAAAVTGLNFPKKTTEPSREKKLSSISLEKQLVLVMFCLASEYCSYTELYGKIMFM
jgi:hypothetical protein